VVYFRWSKEEGWPIVDVSENVDRFLGYTREELIDQEYRFADFIAKEDLGRISQEVAFFEIATKDEFEHSSYRVHTKENGIIWVKDYTKIIRDKWGKIIYYLGYLIDISTYQKSLYDASRYHTIFDRNTLMSLSDTKGNIIDISQELLDLTGYRKEEVLYRPHSIFRHPETPPSVYQALWKTIQDKRVWRGNLKNRKKDGSFFFLMSPLPPCLIWMVILKNTWQSVMISPIFSKPKKHSKNSPELIP